MKKILTMFVVFLFFISLASAIYDPEMEASKEGSPQLMKIQNQEVVGIQTQERMRIQAGDEIILENFNTLKFKERKEGGLIIESENKTVECKEECNITREENKLRIRMSNGINSEIKIMPSVASEKALDALRLKMCANCTLELKEVANRNMSRMTYEMKAQKKAKIFGIFGSKMKVETQIDAETGEVIRMKKPWWAFIASESDEAEAQEE